ncbi:hypothetical protein K438DRAFT_1802710 [Mycena galopus ATCC 62051]|nr:hypothetical protein K438DRAFT_1802710 [Mycena galopus ATCC 62051]
MGFPSSRTSPARRFPTSSVIAGWRHSITPAKTCSASTVVTAPSGGDGTRRHCRTPHNMRLSSRC